MHIHTVKEGESVKDIAELYGINAESIVLQNDLNEDKLTVGEQLLILIPTRTYTPKRNDTLYALSLRFGTKESELCSLNPGLSSTLPLPQRTITLRCGERSYGMAASNGYFYEGCKIEQLKSRIPYITYLTFAAAKMDHRGVSYTFDIKEALAIAKANNLIPILKVFDEYHSGILNEKINKSGLIDSLILFAKAEGFKGIALSLAGCSHKEKEVCEFLVELRGKMIGCDLILITELDERSPGTFADYSDGAVLSYIRSENELNKSYKEAEWEIYSAFACDSESSKAFIDLPIFARRADSFVTVGEAMEIAINGKHKIDEDDTRLYNSFIDKRGEKYEFPSLKNIKATLDLIHEYGFMGISFDVMRTPLPYLTMYNSLFKTTVSGGYSDLGGI